MRIIDKSLTLFAALLGFTMFFLFVVVGTAHEMVLRVGLLLFIRLGS